MIHALAPLYLPSPSWSEFHLGPVAIHAYALCILAGIVAGWNLASRRFQRAGGSRDAFESVLTVAVVAGIVGARLYHVITDHQLYFGPGRNPVAALYIWNGGLGIWGAVALGALAAWWGCRRHKVSFAMLADATAPGILLAQAIGRLGNWFNQELFGRPTTLPWGLEIDAAHRPSGYEQYATFHPTFAYEMLWNLVGVALLLWASRRLAPPARRALRGGQLFAGYVAYYCLGRFWVERLRIDPAHHVGGLRLNDWTALVVLAAALVAFWLLGRRAPAPATAPAEQSPPDGVEAGPERAAGATVVKQVSDGEDDSSTR